ncbi:MAG: LamG domain-containing protein, partial [Planctomycetota bacterium]
EPFVWYYWRVDEVIDGNDVRGDIWSLRTGLGGCLVHFRFQGTPDQELDVNVTDYTGNVTFTQVAADTNGLLTYDADNAFGVPGVTSSRFSPRMGLRRDDPAPPDGFDILRLDVYQWTLEFWVRPEAIDHDTALIQKWGGEGQDQYIFMFDEPEYGYTQIDWRLAELGDGVKSNSESVILGEWNHVVAIFDITSEYPLKMYINAIQQYSLGYPGGMLPGDNTAPVQLGYGQNGWLDGQMDEVRIFDIALGPEDFLYTPGPEWASNPSPYHNELDVDANDPNFALSWTPGIYAKTQDVYFSTSFDDVNERSGSALIADDLVLDINEVNGVDLEFGKTYYWRVDTANDSCEPYLWEGIVWKFTSMYLLLDPNLRAWYKLDETSGITVPDASGYNHHAEAERYQVILPDWEPDGQFDGCMRFDDDTHIDVPSGVLSTIDKEISISVWLNGDSDQSGGDNWIMQAGDDPCYIEVIAPDSSGDVYWRAGGSEANDILVWTDATPRSWEGDWHHFVLIKNENTGLMSIYFDGELKKSKGGTFTTLANLVEQPITVAAALGNMGDYVGKMDDLRIYSKALSEEEVLQLMRGGNLAIAWAPSPYDGQPDAPVNPDLSWRPGDYVADTNGHDVYFGTNRNEVEDANRTNHPNVQYANVSDTTCDVGILDLGQRYYWRVDEVNGPNTWTGPVWRFSVAQYITVDDMENYNPGFSGYPITALSGDYGWDCGYTNDTGSFLNLLHPTSSYGMLSHGGDQAMYYYYDNSLDYPAGYYSEISNHFELDPNDWTYGGVKMLSLWFHGDPENANTGVEQMYVGLEDTSGIGSYSEVRYGDGEGEDVNDIVIAEWQEWNIPLSSFTDVNLKSVDKLYIGFGERYYYLPGGSGGVGFDDIRLYQPTCVPSKAKPDYDLNYDCIVDFGDVEIIADEWLKSDVNLGEVIKPPDANLLGWWELDDGAGPDVWDSSDYW